MTSPAFLNPLQFNALLDACPAPVGVKKLGTRDTAFALLSEAGIVPERVFFHAKGNARSAHEGHSFNSSTVQWEDHFWSLERARWVEKEAWLEDVEKRFSSREGAGETGCLAWKGTSEEDLSVHARNRLNPEKSSQVSGEWMEALRPAFLRLCAEQQKADFETRFPEVINLRSGLSFRM